ncbi:hypothetical protein NUU61_007869 [Penicillium alfredii]|uniref:Uncharacterized protein n=1 Tax=Penicillium alfredii TaxID=1506179 RepID=A0A9W9ERC0_9EURO|nr:uncharacterized protein NUU61_007869 [Penicillium alfredii]KAJ5086562.1 hypothetical protein NUU61_007869 [Penicillium alfredii]
MDIGQRPVAKASEDIIQWVNGTNVGSTQESVSRAEIEYKDLIGELFKSTQSRAGSADRGHAARDHDKAQQGRKA